MPDTVTPAIAAALAKGGMDLTIRALTTFTEKVGGSIKGIREDRQSNLEAHFRVSYERCTRIKTLLNRAEPIDLLSIYVNTKFRLGQATLLDDYTLIEQIGKLKRITITGTGGGGKTIFMKYLWIAICTVKPDKVPVFVELRRLNDLTSDDLLTYVYKSIIGTSSVISEKMFLDAAKKGTVVFILDGFDEISNDKKDVIERQILRFSNENPDAIIIVSGRPDQRFDSWQGFSTYQVVPMSKSQVLDLISKFDYDKNTKANFSRRVKSDLYTKHTTFMSNPLLATMMMLTFDQFADIPEKIYVFYEQAFDTLFSKHDATKEGFKRQHRSGLPIDTFKQCLSYVCLFSYYAEKYAFSSTELMGLVRRSFEITQTKTGIEDFIIDLREAVCILQEESLLLVFTHRSFQEYFAALCLSSYVGDKLFSILENMYLRQSDNVIPMIFEMNQSKIEQAFLLPKLTKLLSDFRDENLILNLEGVSKFFGLEAMINPGEHRKSKKLFYRISFVAGNNRFVFFLLLRKLYRQFLLASQSEMKAMDEQDEAAVMEIGKKYPAGPQFEDYVGANLIFAPEKKSVVVPPGNSYQVVSINEIGGSGFASYWLAVLPKLDELAKAIEHRLSNAQRSIDEILGI